MAQQTRGHDRGNAANREKTWNQALNERAQSALEPDDPLRTTLNIGERLEDLIN